MDHGPSHDGVRTYVTPKSRKSESKSDFFRFFGE